MLCSPVCYSTTTLPPNNVSSLGSTLVTFHGGEINAVSWSPDLFFFSIMPTNRSIYVEEQTIELALFCSPLMRACDVHVLIPDGVVS